LSARQRISERIRRHIRQRTNYLCEYCHAAEQWQYVRFTVDHVIPRAQGGAETLENLALACFHCNRRKADRLTAVDPASGEEVPLFNPRRDVWGEHFIWSADGLSIIGTTPVPPRARCSRSGRQGPGEGLF
jgi:HNH endonuclease